MYFLICSLVCDVAFVVKLVLCMCHVALIKRRSPPKKHCNTIEAGRNVCARSRTRNGEINQVVTGVKSPNNLARLRLREHIVMSRTTSRETPLGETTALTEATNNPAGQNRN
jgi:hypothetical protein